MVDKARHQTGLLLTAMAATAWSLSGFFTRLISADLLTMLFWRGLASGTAVMLVVLYLERGNFAATIRAMRWPSFAVMFFSAAGMITGIGAMRYTSIAEAMVIYATAPFATAALAFVFIGERPSRSTLIAAAVALIGVIVMVSNGGGEGSNFGRLLAVLMSLSLAGTAIVLRQNHDVQMLPAMGASAWLCSAFCFCFASSLAITPENFWLTMVFGVVQNAVGLVLFTFGSKRIPASEAALLAALEVPLAPFWVWVFLAERPALTTLVGGAIVLAALFVHIASEVRNTRPAREQVSI
jgi:drug/metabolite transporter (DMT)-like permease